MIKIGLTGGIGSGKSFVSKIFTELGVPVYNSDIEAKKLYSREDIKKKMQENFGQEVYLSDGQINKVYLANIIFNDRKALNYVNSIIHPLVKEHFEQWMNKQNHAQYIIKEAAILFESGAYKEMDKIIAVTAPLELRIKRVIVRDKTDPKTILNKIEKQLSDEEIIKRSDFHIINNEQKALLPQILKIHEQIMQLKSYN